MGLSFLRSRLSKGTESTDFDFFVLFFCLPLSKFPVVEEPDRTNEICFFFFFLLLIILAQCGHQRYHHTTCCVKNQRSVQYPRGCVLEKPFQAITPLCAAGGFLLCISFSFLLLHLSLFWLFLRFICFKLFAINCQEAAYKRRLYFHLRLLLTHLLTNSIIFLYFSVSFFL